VNIRRLLEEVTAVDTSTAIPSLPDPPPAPMLSTHVDDLALDFVEHEIGANFFVDNWYKFSQQPEAETRVKNWLSNVGATVDSKEVWNALNNLATRGTRWKTPYKTPVPDANMAGRTSPLPK